MMLIDTHCHIHESEFYTGAGERQGVYERARQANCGMLCVGTSQKSSRQAVAFAQQHEAAWAVVGVHPHDVKHGWAEVAQLLARPLEERLIVGIGEIGLDYFYDNSPRELQRQALEQQLQWALDYALPVCFHVRDEKGDTGVVWRDFWPIYANFPQIRGVLHSFTDTVQTLHSALERGLYIGVNGISTFARDKQAMWDTVPLEKMLLETDAPFLTPEPFRGKVNEPAYLKHIVVFHANRRGISEEVITRKTTENASVLFGLNEEVTAPR